jgi:hypothetical protein
VLLRMQAAFVADDVNNIIKEAVDGALMNAAYNHTKVNWTTSSQRLHLKKQLPKQEQVVKRMASGSTQFQR